MSIERIRFNKFNIWSITLTILILIVVFLYLLVTAVGEKFIVEDQTNKLLKSNLDYAKEMVEDNFYSLELTADLIIQNYKMSNKSHLRGLSTDISDGLTKFKPDFIFLVNSDGKIKWSKNNHTILSKSYNNLNIIKKGLDGRRVSGYEIIPEEIIELEGLSQPTSIKIKAANGTNYLKREINKNGLSQVISIPLYNEKGQLNELLIIGSLINKNGKIFENNLHTIDGLISIFLDGIRILVKDKGQVQRSLLGTLMDENIYKETFKEGKDYFGETNILDSSYKAAYRPIRGLDNKVVGAIGVTINQEPLLISLKAFKFRVYLLMLIILVLNVMLVWWLYKSLIKGIWYIVKGVKEISEGNYSTRILSPEILGRWKISHCQYSSFVSNYTDHICKINCNNITNKNLKELCPGCSLTNENLHNDVYYLANTFNYLAVALEKRENILKERNRILIEQQEELAAQQQNLMALNQQLEATIEDLDIAEDIIYTLALAIEAKDPYTKGHSERVAKYAKELAKFIGLPNSQQDILGKAGILHDIGKIGVRDSILLKAEKLSELEYEEIKQHPIIGQKICNSLNSAKDIIPIIKYHHEHFNGTGYPEGLKGYDIPLLARMLSIVDAYDAMITDRPYRKGMKKECSVLILKEDVGQFWDPELVEAFVKMLNQNS